MIVQVQPPGAPPLLVANVYYWHSKQWDLDNTALHMWTQRKLQAENAPFIWGGDRNMSPKVYEQSNINQRLDAVTVAVSGRGTCRHTNQQGVHEWNNLDHFNVSSALTHLISAPWVDVYAETPTHLPVQFDMEVPTVTAQRFARGATFPADITRSTCFSQPVNWGKAL